MTGMKCDISHRTISLREYVLSDLVSIDSTEFLPFQAALQLLETTSVTLKQRIETGEINEKTFFMTEPEKRTYLGVEIGSVKRLMVEKAHQTELIKQCVLNAAKNKQIISYSDILDAAGLSWKSPPARKFCNDVLDELNDESYAKTIDSARTCLLGALVVTRNSYFPSDRFFKKACSLGLLDHGASKEEEISFWEIQKQNIFNEYGE